MMYRYRLLCLLLILGFSANINCMYSTIIKLDGGEQKEIWVASWWLISATVTSGAGLAYLIGKDIFARLSTNRPLKNNTSLSATLTPEQIKFQEIQNTMDQRILLAVQKNEYTDDSFAEFRERRNEMHNKHYSTELSEVLLKCLKNENNETDPESIKRFNFCLEHTNSLAKEKEAPQEKEPVKTGEDNPQN